jgi:plastocyanin
MIGRFLPIGLAASVVVGLTGAPQAGVIHGRVLQPEVTIRNEARPSIGAIASTTHGAVDRRIAVVYLDAAPRQAFETMPARRARMDQRREQFVPRVLAVTAGTVVDFPNNDLLFHNVMSLAPGNSFDLGRYPKGQSRSVHFDTPGIVPIICDIHAHMSAYVLVFSHPFFAVTDDEGRYSLALVPAGTHTLKVWSELGTADAKRVTLGAGPLEADFKVERRAR